jgi:hypothetical protein
MIATTRSKPITSSASAIAEQVRPLAEHRVILDRHAICQSHLIPLLHIFSGVAAGDRITSLVIGIARMSLYPMPSNIG